jgi:outer membrane receptor protein involved in Fe transport
MAVIFYEPTQTPKVKSTMTVFVRLAVCCCALAVTVHAQTLRGIVVDQNGAVIADADVTVKSGARTRQSVSAPDGHFSFSQVTPPAEVSAARAGFATGVAKWSGSEDELRIVLSPAAVEQQIVVSATRTEAALSEIASSVTLFDKYEIEQTPALIIDQLLREAPGFSLFRRSDSRTANPTSQGVSLRGLGASGASRALVLYNGVILNDPFGGWVYWDRVPMTDVRQVEVLRGGASALYGAGALAGVINVESTPRTSALLDVDLSAGTDATRVGSATGSAVLGKWTLKESVQSLETAGYIPLPRQLRGTADAPANVRYGTGRLEVDRKLTAGTVFVIGALFNESRQNGTVLQNNNTRLAEPIAGAELSVAGGTLRASVNGSGQRYNQSFSSVSLDRNTETLVRTQQVPAQQMAASAQWARPILSNQVLVIGGDVRNVRGDSDELLWTKQAPTSRVVAGGRQLLTGAFAEALFRIGPRTHITAAVRLDSWRNYNALATTINLVTSASPVQQVFPRRSQTAFSPSLGGVIQATHLVAITASGYGSFRAPTLNELYRTFRLGNVQTLANDALKVERLWGGEAGVTVGSGPLFARATVFYSKVEDAVGNRTLSVTPALITRQRQNFGTLLSRGVELETRARLPWHTWLRTAYQFSNAKVSQSADVALIGLMIPQVPLNSVSTEAGYDGRRLSATVAGRYVGRQFDDDQNQFLLGGYFTSDAMLAYRPGGAVQLFIAGENLFDRPYAIARTPTVSLGAPRFIRAGIRWSWRGRDSGH